MDLGTGGNDFIDLEDGLSRIGGNAVMYKRLLGRFVDGDYFDKLEQSLNGGDVEEALRQAHSLKGLSANLSLIKIQAVSVELEQLLKTGDDYSATLGELKQAFIMTAEKIREFIDEK